MASPVPDLKKTSHIKTFGHSMYPLLHDGDIVYFKKTSLHSLNVNDNVVIKKQKRYITHRIVYKTKKYIITKGDNNLETDGKTYGKSVIGKVYKIKRGKEEFDPEMVYLIQSSLYLKEIQKILIQFNKKSINYIILKGLPLHLHYSGTHPRRIYADCDVLVHRNDYKRAFFILKKNNYTKSPLSLFPLQEQLRSALPSELSFYKYVHDFPIVFDVHREVVFDIPKIGQLNVLYPTQLLRRLTDEIMHSKKKVAVKGVRYPIVSPTYLIVYLALHLFNHASSGTHRYELLHEVILKEAKKNSRKIWIEIEEIIEKYRLENYIYPVFYNLKKYYKTPMPKNVLRRYLPDSYSTKKRTKHILSQGIFDEELLVKRGINRFINLFLFSPVPLYKRIFVFFYPSVIVTILWVVGRRVRKRIIVSVE